jgi:hypothetical protein
MQILHVISNYYSISCADTAYSIFSFICVYVYVHVLTIDGMSTKWIQFNLFNGKNTFLLYLQKYYTDVKSSDTNKYSKELQN